jgi:hypothetical protein
LAFVNWLKDISSPVGDSRKETHPPADAILWVHPVTGTRYFLEADTAAEITRCGLAWVEALRQNCDPTIGADYLADFLAKRDIFSRKLYLEENGLSFGEQKIGADVICGDIPLVVLWPELPYPGQVTSGEDEKVSLSGWLRGENKPCVRLADFLLLRTGLFFALAANHISRQGWPSLRLTSLLDGSGVFRLQEGLSGLVPIPEELRGAYEIASFLAGYPDVDRVGDASGTVEVVEGGVFKVKEYYLETNRIGEIRGASVLLDDINRYRYIQMFRELPELTTESIIYAGGGHLMAVVPAGKGEKVAGEIERLHREVCLTARAVGVACEERASELANFGKLRGRLTEELVKRRNVLIPAWDTTDGAIDLYHEGFLLGKNIPPLLAEPGKCCTSCGIRPATRVLSYEEEDRPLCASCLRKQCVGMKAGKTVFAEEYRRFWQARGESADLLPEAREIEEIADNSNEIAVIYADGNNFGPLFGRCESLAELRLLSQFTESAAYTATFTALRECRELLEGRAVEIIALGGDDIFMLVPARAALPLAVAIGKHFDRVFKNLTASEPGATLSLGVVIAGSKTPVRYLFELAQALLKEAKSRVYRAYKAKGALEEGTLDVAVLSSYAAYEDNITAYRKATLCKNDVTLTLRPYTFSEARCLMNAVRQLQVAPQVPGRSWFYGLRQMVEQYGRQVAELFFNYQYARLSEVQRKTLKKSWETLTGQSGDPGMFCERDGRRYCPWLDVVELWNYVGAGGETH